MSRPDGGPAFPTTFKPHDTPPETSGGMTLRDYFAGQALAGLLSERHAGQPGLYYDPPATSGKDAGDGHAWIPERRAQLWANNAYRLADAMLEGRGE